MVIRPRCVVLVCSSDPDADMSNPGASLATQTHRSGMVAKPMCLEFGVVTRLMCLGSGIVARPRRMDLA